MSGQGFRSRVVGYPVRLGRWLMDRQPFVLIVALGIVLPLWGMIELTEEVLEGDTAQFDEWVIASLRDPADRSDPIGPAWLSIAAIDLTALGGAPVLILAVMAVACFMALQKKSHAMWLVLIASGSGWLISMVLKELLGRERPAIVPHLVEVQSLSFPSGHAMMSAVVYLTLGIICAQMVTRWDLRAYLLGLALFLTLLVGSTRVFLGVHYPTDVLAGWSVGLIWALLCWLVVRWLQNRGTVEKSIQAPETP